MLCALKSRTEPNDLCFALWSLELNLMICALRSEVSNWTKWFAFCALKSQTEVNDSRFALWSPELNSCTQKQHPTLINAVLSGIIGKMKWKCQWHISEDSWFPSEIHKHPRCVLTLTRAAFIFIQWHHFFLKFNHEWNWKTSWNYKWRLVLNHLVYLQLCLCSVFTSRKEIYF